MDQQVVAYEGMGISVKRGVDGWRLTRFTVEKILGSQVRFGGRFRIVWRETPQWSHFVNELDLFTEALKRTDPAGRAAFLDQACAGNPELRRRLEDRLAGHPRGGGPLDRPPLSSPGSSETVDLAAALVTGEHRPGAGEEPLTDVDPNATADVVRRASTPLDEVTGEFRTDQGAATIDHADPDATTATSKELAPSSRGDTRWSR